MAMQEASAAGVGFTRPTGFRGRMALAALLAGSPLLALMFAALGPVLPMMATHFADGDDGTFATQMIMTVPAIGVIIGGLMAGFMVDRFGPRPVLLWGLGVYGVAGSSGLYLDSLWPLLATRVVVGLAIAHAVTSVGVIVGGWFQGLARVRFLGYQAAVAGISALIFLISSGVIAEHFSWRAPFALYLLAFVVLAISAAAIRSEEVPARERDAPSPAGAFRPLFPIYGVALFLFTAYFMTSIQLSFLLAAENVTSPLTRSFVIAGGVLAGGLCGGSYGWVVARIGSRGAQILLTTLLGSGLIVIGTADSLAVIAIGAIMSGGGGGMIPPHIESRLLATARIEVRARAISFMFTALYVADFLNPLVVSPIRSGFGIHAAFIAIGSVLVLAAVPLAMRTPKIAHQH